MPHFYFDIAQGPAGAPRDFEGIQLPSLEAAEAEALRLLEDISTIDRCPGTIASIFIRDAAGVVCSRVRSGSIESADPRISGCIGGPPNR